MRACLWLGLGLPLLLLPRLGAAAVSPAPFAAGDRWVAVGDNITHTGTYPLWVALYYATRFPGLRFEVVNAGLWGDTAEGALKRLDWDIAAVRPTVATLLLGMNDVGRSLYAAGEATPAVRAQRQARLEAHRAALRRLVAGLQAAGTRVVLMTPTIYDEAVVVEGAAPGPEGVNEALLACAAFGRELAAETGAALVDLHAPMDRLNFELQKADPKATIIGPERMQPGAPGQLLIAYYLLKAQGVPALVGRADLDAGTCRVLAAERGQVTKLRWRYNGLQWRWTAEALPLPIEREARPALGWVPIMEDLNREIVQVRNLKPGHYLLQIDEVDIRAFSAEELAAGVNLATEATTPQARQAAQVLALLQQWQVTVERLRRIAQIEHQTAPDLPRPVTAEQMQPLVNQRMSLLRGSTASPGTLKTLEAYAELKPQEERLRGDAAKLLEAARRAAQPRMHEYRLVRLE